MCESVFCLISFSNFAYKNNCYYFHIDTVIFHIALQSTSNKSLQFHSYVYPCYFTGGKLDQNSPEFWSSWNQDLGFPVSAPPLLLIDMVFPVATVGSHIISHFRRDSPFPFFFPLFFSSGQPCNLLIIPTLYATWLNSATPNILLQSLTFVPFEKREGERRRGGEEWILAASSCPFD